MNDDTSDVTLPDATPLVTPPSQPGTEAARNPSRRPRARRVRGCLIAALAVLLVLISGTTAAALSGRVPIVATALHSAGTLIRPAPSPSPTRTEPTATPTPAPGCRQQASAYVCYTVGGDAVPAPAIPGLTQTLRPLGDENIITYVAAPGNPYGLPTGRYAGEFTDHVDVELPNGASRLSGGVVLEPQVVLTLLNQQLAALAPQSNKWIVPLPLDPRPSTGPNAPSYVHVRWASVVGPPTVLLTFNGTAPVPNIIAPVANTFPDHDALIEQTDGRGYSGQGTNFPPYYTKVWPGREMSYITVRWSDPALKFTFDIQHTTFGQSVVAATSDVYVLYGAIEQSNPVVPPTKVLTIGGSLDAGGVPVFLATS